MRAHLSRESIRPAVGGTGLNSTGCSTRLLKGDVLVVWRLDRLSRSLRDVLTIMERLREPKAVFRSLTEAIDTTTPFGRLGGLPDKIGAG